VNKPVNIKYAIILILSGVVVSLVSFVAMSIQYAEFMPNKTAMYISFLFTTVLFIFFTYKINQGKNWARLLYSVCVVLTFFDAVIQIEHFSNLPIFVQVSSVYINITQLVILYLLFNAGSRNWFSSFKTDEIKECNKATHFNLTVL
jgi:hypothetical protein